MKNRSLPVSARCGALFFALVPAALLWLPLSFSGSAHGFEGDAPPTKIAERRADLSFTVNALETVQKCREALRAAEAGIVNPTQPPKEETENLERYRKARKHEARDLLDEVKRWKKEAKDSEQKHIERLRAVLKKEITWLENATAGELYADRSVWLEAKRAPLRKAQQEAFQEYLKLVERLGKP